jgi:hypothetical protein
MDEKLKMIFADDTRDEYEDIKKEHYATLKVQPVSYSLTQQFRNVDLLQSTKHAIVHSNQIGRYMKQVIAMFKCETSTF